MAECPCVVGLKHLAAGLHGPSPKVKILEIEYLAQQRFALVLGLRIVRAFLAVVAFVVALSPRPTIIARGLDELIELTAIEPYTPALRAIIDLDALSFSKLQFNAAMRAIHSFSFV